MKSLKPILILSAIFLIVGGGMFVFSVLQGFIDDTLVNQTLAVTGAVTFFGGLLIFIVGTLSIKI